jgi:predicted O-methyltransferase YrrM
MKTPIKRLAPNGRWSVRWALRQSAWRTFRRIMESCGFVVARTQDYYSPLPSEASLRRNCSRWARPSSLSGISCNLTAMKERLTDLRERFYEEFLSLPPHAEAQAAGFGPGYPEVDAFTLYAMIRALKPKRYLEIGSGLSTYYCNMARQKNLETSHDTQITCVEPHPFEKLRDLDGIELIQSEVQSVSLATFAKLQEGDVFFIDSSHVLRIDGDVPFLFLEVLPNLAAGVHIHIHDVPFPYNVPYPSDYWTTLRHPQSPHWPMFWNEAMVVQAFLAFNSSFETTLSTPFIRHADEDFLRATLPCYQPIAQLPNTFSSLWIKRVR